MPALEEESSLDLNAIVGRVTRFITTHKWWIVIPFCVVSLVTIATLLQLPDRYTSTAALLVVQQQIPERYVVPNSNTDVASALQAMKQEVLSRTQLLRMIDDFGLYPKERKYLVPEQLVTLMLSNIDIVPTTENPRQGTNKDFDSFRISFTTENALLAQKVTSNLTALFINEYLRTGAEHATNTTSFLHEQVAAKAKELEAQEIRLKNFKLSHIGELPEQQAGNLGILTGLQNRLQNTQSSLTRAQQQQVLWQAQLDATPRRRPAADLSVVPIAPGAPASTQATPVQIAQSNLAFLEGEKAKLLAKSYTPQHPDLKKVLRDIAQAEATLNQLKATAPPPEKASAPLLSNSRVIEPGEDPAVSQLKNNLEVNRLEIDSLRRDEKQLRDQISRYEARINSTPVAEQQQTGIVRDTEALRQQYAELLKREQESQLATNLEKQQGGQQFRLIDAASLPSLPSSPKRLKLSLSGLAGGLALGLALAVLMELRDTSFRSEKEMAKYLSAPLVMGIPVLYTSSEERRLKASKLLQWGMASAMVLVVLAAELYVYKRG